MDGILLINKPAGWTSFDVVNKVRHTIQASGLSTSNRKRFPVGHTGTLDPLATGLLVLMLGAYTKKVPQYTKLDKTYEVTMRLGQTSATGDEEGEKTSISPKKPSKEALYAILQGFVGESMQTPPAFSAIKINGQRAYKLARKGAAPKLEPRPVKIYSIEFTSYEYPDVRFTTEVSSGTYIRSLVEDIGAALGVGAYMAALCRTKVGDFSLEDAVQLDGLTSAEILRSLRVA